MLSRDSRQREPFLVLKDVVASKKNSSKANVNS